MRTVMNFNVTDTKVKVTVTIPFGMENVCFQHINGKVFFAFMIGGHLYRPQMKDIIKFQKMGRTSTQIILSTPIERKKMSW